MHFKIHVISFFVAFILASSPLVMAQLLDSAALASQPVFKSIEEGLKNPEQVYRLSLKKNKLTAIPIEISKFVNLQELDISKNRLKELPVYFENLTHLQYLDASSNHLTSLPPEIGKCIELKKMVLNRNFIEELPSTMGYLNKLEHLDLWSNSIVEFPESFVLLQETLKVLDLRVINMNLERQEAIKALLPKTLIYFSRTCNCN